MDALGAYGSDDDSSNSSEPDSNKKSAALVGLTYSSDEQEDKGDSKETVESQRNHVPADTSPPSRKRKRTGDKSHPASDNSDNSRQSLPLPPVSDTSLVQWNVDYTAEYRVAARDTQEQTQSKKLVIDKLARLYEKSQENNKTSFAEQLKTQKEFHNPHFFDSVVSHFGIQDPLSISTEQGKDFEPFEYNVVQAEEQARIRQANQHQQERNA